MFNSKPNTKYHNIAKFSIYQEKTNSTQYTQTCVSRPDHALQSSSTIGCNYLMQNYFDISGIMLEITFVYQVNRKQHNSRNFVPKWLPHHIIVHYNIIIHHIYGLVQERCNSIANTLELHFSCTNHSISSDKIWKCVWDDSNYSKLERLRIASMRNGSTNYFSQLKLFERWKWNMKETQMLRLKNIYVVTMN